MSCFAALTTPNRTLCPSCRDKWEKSPCSSASGSNMPTGFLGGGFGTGGFSQAQMQTSQAHMQTAQAQMPAAQAQVQQQQMFQQTQASAGPVNQFSFASPPPLTSQQQQVLQSIQQQQQTSPSPAPSFDFSSPPPMNTTSQRQTGVAVNEVKKAMNARCSVSYSSCGNVMFVHASLTHKVFYPLSVEFVLPTTPEGIQALQKFQSAFVQMKSIVDVDQSKKQITLNSSVRIYTVQQWFTNGQVISDDVARNLLTSIQ